VGLPGLHARFKSHRDTIERAQAWFGRFGGWLLTFGYFIPGVRHVTAIAAGTGCLNYPRFAAFAYPGAVLWCGTFLGLGYFAGDRWPEVAGAVRAHAAQAALLAVALFVIVAVTRTVIDRRRSRSSS